MRKMFGVAKLGSKARVGLKPISTGLTSVISMLILIQATRLGQLPDIAGYMAGAGVGGIASAFAGSGTSMAYITGDAMAQNGVRRVRQFIVAPVMVLSVLIASLVYIRATELGAFSILMGGVSAVLNNLAELDSASLERNLETPRLLFGSVMSRLVGLVLVLAGMTFSGAMLASAIVLYVSYRLFARIDSTPVTIVPRLLDSLRVAYAPSLVGQSLLSIVVTRAALVVAPFVMPATYAGALSSLVSVQQAASGVLISALYTLMAVQSETRGELDWMRRFANGILVASAFASVGAAISAPLVIDILNLGSLPGAELWWVLLALAVLPYVINRRFQYRALGAGMRGHALLIVGCNATVTGVAVAVATVLDSSNLLAASSLLAEGGVAAGIAAGAAYATVRRRTSKAPTGTP